MSTNHTPNYQLNQWERTDKVLMDDFNADNAKIDAALAGKADKSALNALSQTVSGHTAALNRKGNCQIYLSTYVGTGTFGEENPNSFTFPGKPLFVVIGGQNNRLIMAFRGQVNGLAWRGSEPAAVVMTWSGNTISWYSSVQMVQLNWQNVTYNIMALIAVDE